MKRITTRTVRFTAIVQKCGAPRTATLWLAPEQDKEFMKAANEQRVMTIDRQNAGTRKDFGMVGFHKRAGAVYLIFPKKLDEFADARVVGINLDLIHEPEIVDPVPQGAAARRASPRRSRGSARNTAPPPEPEREPRKRKFTVQVRAIATVLVPMEVEALNKSEAKRRALGRFEPDWTNAKIKMTAMKVEAAE